MSDRDNDYRTNARARTALSLKMLGITQEALSEMSSARGNIARYASGGKDEFNGKALIDEGADYSTIDRITELENRGVKLDYQALSKMDREEVREHIRQKCEDHDAYGEEEGFETEEE